MESAIPDLAVQRDALLDLHLDAAGLARWARDLVKIASLSVGLTAEVRVGTDPGEWSVEVRTAGGPDLLVDVDSNAPDQASLDRLELRAEHVWRDLTRGAALFEPRPWIGAVRVTQAGAADVVGVERVQRLVASRTLDAGCVVVIDRSAGAVRSLSPVLSIESFAASVAGRCLVVAAHTASAR